MNLTVYCASSNRIADVYVEAAAELGELIGRGGHTLVYGGGRVGLMGVVASAVHEHGGRVFGVIPKALRAIEGVAYEVADDLVETQTMQERKALMFNLAHAFIVLPGGYGTLEELMEVLTLKQLGYHEKALVLVNTASYFDPLLALFEHFYNHRFVSPDTRALFHVAATPAEAMRYVLDYSPPRSGTVRTKWE